MVFLVQKKKKVVGVRFGDGLLLTASVVEDAHRHRSGTTRPFYRTVADIKHYLLDTQNKNRPNHIGLGLLNIQSINLLSCCESPYLGTQKHLSNQQGQFPEHRQC